MSDRSGEASWVARWKNAEGILPTAKTSSLRSPSSHQVQPGNGHPEAELWVAELSAEGILPTLASSPDRTPPSPSRYAHLGIASLTVADDGSAPEPSRPPPSEARASICCAPSNEKSNDQPESRPLFPAESDNLSESRRLPASVPHATFHAAWDQFVQRTKVDMTAHAAPAAHAHPPPTPHPPPCYVAPAAGMCSSSGM